MTSLTGQLLISMPQMMDPYFSHSVVYLCSHSSETGAMGLVVNKTIESLTIGELYAQLKIDPVTQASRQQPIHFGGPVATGHGFVLHSPDYREEDTLVIGEDFALTATTDILRAKGGGRGPRQSLVALGYAGWGAGQLERELQENVWLTCDPDEDLLFGADHDAKWTKALAKIGVSASQLSHLAGRA